MNPVPSVSRAVSTLGQPLSIAGVARLIGCSAWSVRQTLLPQGLPHFRSGPNGKLIFYEQQVVRWIEARQQRSLARQLSGGVPMNPSRKKGGPRA